jgi:hypothetical protein
MTNKAGDCLEFTGKLDPNGYGYIHHNGRTQYAHRASYIEANGPIPDGMVVMHSCDNRPCINPEHLSVGTHEDNRLDMMAKGRNSKGTMHKGAKLDDDKVRYIRQSKLKLSELQEMFGVSQGVLSEVRRGLRWAHVQ